MSRQGPAGRYNNSNNFNAYGATATNGKFLIISTRKKKDLFLLSNCILIN